MLKPQMNRCKSEHNVHIRILQSAITLGSSTWTTVSYPQGECISLVVTWTTWTPHDQQLGHSCSGGVLDIVREGQAYKKNKAVHHQQLVPQASHSINHHYLDHHQINIKLHKNTPRNQEPHISPWLHRFHMIQVKKLGGEGLPQEAGWTEPKDQHYSSRSRLLA
jgi:hypothetical protein